MCLHGVSVFLSFLCACPNDIQSLPAPDVMALLGCAMQLKFACFADNGNGE